MTTRGELEIGNIHMRYIERSLPERRRGFRGWPGQGGLWASLHRTRCTDLLDYAFVRLETQFGWYYRMTV